MIATSWADKANSTAACCEALSEGLRNCTGSMLENLAAAAPCTTSRSSASRPRSAYLSTKHWIDRAAGAVVGALGLKLMWEGMAAARRGFSG